MKPLPDTILVNGHHFKIIICPDRSLEDGNDSVGSASHRSNTIWIDGRQTIERQWSVLLHEIIEIINYDYQLDLTHPQICTLDAALWGVIVGNEPIQTILLERELEAKK